MGEILDSRAPPAETELKEAARYREIGNYAAAGARKWPSGMGDIPRPREGAVNLFPQALREGSRATARNTTLLRPHRTEPPRALRYPARRRAAEAGRVRQARGAVGASFLSTGLLALQYLRCIVDGEVANAWVSWVVGELC